MQEAGWDLNDMLLTFCFLHKDKFSKFFWFYGYEIGMGMWDPQ